MTALIPHLLLSCQKSGNFKYWASDFRKEDKTRGSQFYQVNSFLSERGGLCAATATPIIVSVIGTVIAGTKNHISWALKPFLYARAKAICWRTCHSLTR